MTKNSINNEIQNNIGMIENEMGESAIWKRIKKEIFY